MRRSTLSNLASLVAAVLSATIASAQNEQNELDLITARRVIDLATYPDPSWFRRISTWLDTQKDDGTWDDVNYLSGCQAQSANWPIQQHWNRLITFAAAWSGANPTVPSNWTDNNTLWNAVSKGLDYWLDNDYEPDDCMGEGGTEGLGCACGTPGLWNPNWYAQAILIPQLCSTLCLLVKDADLSGHQRVGCERIPLRAYKLRDKTYGRGGAMTGANAILVMQNSVSLALYTNNTIMLADAFDRAMSVITFVDKAREDGIHRDGSFLQHNGVLYNGNYGKDLFNAFIQLESEAIGTIFAANDTTRDALATQLRGNEWMIHVDEKTRREYWDFNVIGRFVGFPTQDLQASSDINFNTTKLKAATADFEGANNVNETIRRLLSNGTEKLVGNKGFWASDYMVHRRDSFVVTNKMLSERSLSSESLNNANPFGYHMGQGTLFSYVTGNEYKDIVAAWDWNLVPGITALLNHPKLESSNVRLPGKKDFVGVVSDGRVGTAVEDYVDPYDESISYRKAWFFLEDSVLVTTTDVKLNHSVPDAAKKPVISVLDNRAAAASGKIWVDGKRVSAAGGKETRCRTLFYGGNGYMSYEKPFDLTLFEGKRTGNWSAISTSTLGETSVSIFSAYTAIPSTTYTYAFFPASSRRRLAREMTYATSKPISGPGISGIAGNGKLSLVFWPGGKSSITVSLAEIGWAKTGFVTIQSDQPAAYLLSSQSGKPGRNTRLAITLSEPTQKATKASFSLIFRGAYLESISKDQEDTVFKIKGGAKFNIALPTGGLAGSSISRDIYIGFR